MTAAPPRVPLPPSRASRLALALTVALSACEGTAPPPRPTRTVGSVRGGGSRGGRRSLQGAADPPAVDSVERCPQETNRVLARLRARAGALHFGPLCTGVFRGQFAAVLVTGTLEEASDAWVVFHGTRGDEVRRVANFPVGAHLEFGRIQGGWVYLAGTGVALEDQPASTRVLAIFPLPRPGEAHPPEVRELAPLEVSLLGATDVQELSRRLSLPVPERDPSAREAEATVRAIARGGTNALLDALSPEGAPTLRAWQPGAFQERDHVSPQGDPADPRTSRTTALIRELAEGMDCSAGDRCVATPTQPLTAGATPTQVLLRYEGTRVVLAGVITGAQPPQTPAGEPRAWGNEVRDAEEDRQLASTLALDGEVDGEVVASTRGDERVIAFRVASRGASHPSDRTRAYVLRQGHAPRGFLDDAASHLLTASPELHLRDYERDGGFEVVSVGRSSDGATVFSMASASPVARVAQHRLTPRWDMARTAFGAPTLRDVDGRLRGFQAFAMPEGAGCALLDRLAEGGSRALLAGTRGALLVITYAEPGQPMLGTVQRLGRPELQRMRDPREALGQLAGLRCQDLRCDWAQGFCRAERGNELGVLWFADDGARLAAVSRREGR